MFDALKKTFSLFERRELCKMGILLCAMIATSILEVVSIGSVVPIFSLISNTNLIEQQPIIRKLYHISGADNADHFLLLLGFLSGALIFLSSIALAALQYFMIWFVIMQQHKLAQRLLTAYLHQPYSFFLNRSSGELAKNTLAEVGQFVNGFLMPCLMVASKLFTLVAIITLLFGTNAKLAMGSFFLFGGLYATIFFTVKKRLNRAGEVRVVTNKIRFKLALEALGGIKIVKLHGHESTYLSRFWKASGSFAKSQVLESALSRIPRYLVEAIAIVGVLFLALTTIIATGGLENGAFSKLLPTFGVFIYSTVRLLPTTQGIYSGVARAKAGVASVNRIHSDFMACSRNKRPKRNQQSLTLKHSIQLADVCFTYPRAAKPALSDINATIKKGKSLGIVGSTGAGKTTLVDVLLGLFEPTSGHLLMDSQAINKKLIPAWQKILGYVPQEIFLTDQSIERNIAFGLEPEEIDGEWVRACAKMAHIHDFVMSELPNGYKTEIGERGVRLSGGQRQRIGIARTLYSKPEVIVFDEATSALDNKTERQVMEAINCLQGNKTLILIAHRLSTVANCDQIMLLNKGKIEAIGTYQSLLKTSTSFRELATSA